MMMIIALHWLVLFYLNCGPWESATHLSSRIRLAWPICTTLQIMVDKSFLNSVRARYAEDAWCKTLPAAAVSWPDLVFQDGLWYVGDRLIVPRTNNLRETLFILAHNVLGHLVSTKHIAH